MQCKSLSQKRLCLFCEASAEARCPDNGEYERPDVKPLEQDTDGDGCVVLLALFHDQFLRFFGISSLVDIIISTPKYHKRDSHAWFTKKYRPWRMKAVDMGGLHNFCQ